MEMASALTKRENASLYSETCSSVNESAYIITLLVKDRWKLSSGLQECIKNVHHRIAPQPWRDMTGEVTRIP